jgi:hypothetical protein
MRLRVRTLMAAVGVAALLIWGAMMGSLSYDYYQRATFFASEEYAWRESAARDRLRAPACLECAEYFAQLTRKYRRAMWRPWMTVAPDPHAPGYDQWIDQKPWRKRSPPFLPHPDFLRPRVSDRGRRSTTSDTLDFSTSDTHDSRGVSDTADEFDGCLDSRMPLATAFVPAKGRVRKGIGVQGPRTARREWSCFLSSRDGLHLAGGFAMILGTDERSGG